MQERWTNRIPLVAGIPLKAAGVIVLDSVAGRGGIRKSKGHTSGVHSSRSRNEVNETALPSQEKRTRRVDRYPERFATGYALKII